MKENEMDELKIICYNEKFAAALIE